jgi:ribonuclease HII
MVKVLGIDEAGRGPIIGDLVIAGAMMEEDDEGKLVNIGVKDSKLVSRRNRALIYKKIVGILKGYEIMVVSPEEIDEVLFSQDLNLNKLEAIKSAMIINKLEPDKAILDCPSPNVESYKEYVRTLLKNKDVELIVEHKADLNYPIAGAASILAKVTRDLGVEELEKKHGVIGSGYPADERTQDFIKKNFEKCPEIFRRSWSTFKNLEKEKKQKKLGEF